MLHHYEGSTNLYQNSTKILASTYTLRNWIQKTLLLFILATGLTTIGKAQVYYTLNDGSPTSTTDQLRRINLDGTGDALIKTSFVQTAGLVVLDATNNRLLVADARISQPSTSTANTKIVAVSLGTGNPTTTLVTPYITGSASTIIAGMAIDRINNYLYYTLNDGSPTATADQLRRINLDGTGDVLIKTNFVQTAGLVALDAANNRLLVVDARISQPSTSTANTKIVAVSLGTGNPITTLVTPYITSSTSTVIAGMAIDRINNYLYYTLNDGSPTATADQLRRINLDGTGDALIKTNFVQTAGLVVLDAANNRLLVVDARISQPSTSTANTKIVAVSLGTGNPTTTLVTPYVTGSTSTAIEGLTINNQDPPTVATSTPAGVSTTAATLGGNVTSDGGVTVTERGILYSTTNNSPTIGGSGVTKDTNGSGSGAFSKSISALTPGTTYYGRAYAINAISTSYGSVVTFTTTPNAPVVTTPVNGTYLTTLTPTYTGTTQANSTVTVYVDGTPLNIVIANGLGNWSLTQTTNLSQGSHTVRATATIGSSATSASSNTNTFIVDTVRPSVTITSSAGSSSSTTSSSPVPFTLTFSESVTGLVASDVDILNGVLSNFNGNGATYTFVVTPASTGLIRVNVAANVAQDVATNGNTAAEFFITYQPTPPTITSFTAVNSSVCAGGVVGFTATLTNTASGYTYTLSDGQNSVSGSGTGTSFSQSLTVTTTGLRTFTLTVVSNGQSVSASTPVTVSTGMTTLKTGSWTDVSVWSCGRTPLSTDVVQINHVVSLPASYQGQVLKVIYGAGGRIIVNAGSRLQIALP